MIKEYFTDGLIGLAILLSLFRTDLIGINNLINYPEVQDIILGPTAAYLPVNFHNSLNYPNLFSNQKYIDLDFDNGAFTAWYQNIQNLPLFREGRENEIEAFLVSGSNTDAISEQFQADPPASASTVSNNGPESSSPTLPLEGAYSFTEDVSSHSNVNSTSSAVSASDSEPVVTDASYFLNNPFPGCNLTKEDLDLIDVLWRQDVDLGVGKEVYDQALRQELEREHQLEYVKQQEKQKAQLLARRKEEQQRQEQAGKWLKQNFKRDGETGEWVRLQNESQNVNKNYTSQDTSQLETDTFNDEFLTLEAALDFISASVDPNILQDFENGTNNAVDPFSEPCSSSILFQSPGESQESQQQPEQPVVVEPQVNLEENWQGLVNFLDLSSTNTAEVVDNNAEHVLCPVVQPVNPPVELRPGMDMLANDMDQSEYLLQNATLPVGNADLANDFDNHLTPLNNFNMSAPLPCDTAMDWDLEEFNFFSNMTVLNNTVPEDLNLTAVSDIFMSLEENTESNNYSAITEPAIVDVNADGKKGMLQDNSSESAISEGSTSPHNEWNDTFDGLEGATGGADLSSHHEDNKIHRMSESSNDSGFAYHGDFYPSSSPSSSYGGSPSSSQYGNGSTSYNDTEHDPHGSRAVCRHQVAHNHTYNTPPGQVPREVKKYAHKEPSRKGPQGRDHRRAQELKIPFTVEEIIGSPVETFNEMLTNYKLSEVQLNLIRDIRRRGKNKVAAQNCRKRKVGVIVTLSDEMVDLQKARDRLVAERAEVEREARRLREKFSQLHAHIFQSLRDDRGQPYDPNVYSLQQSSDGNVFLVPRAISGNDSPTGASSLSSSPSSTKDSSSDTSVSRKRKTYDE